MKKSLVIVESPAKAKTISRYLGEEFEVKASVGHIRDLPKKKIGVDVKDNFAATYEIIPGKEKVVQELKRAAAKADRIFLAADPDREGEAICHHIKEEIDNGKKAIYRVMFNEITKEAVNHAFESPGTIDENLVRAQNTRRILDRLVGYLISPLLWKKVRRGLSAGRVQTVATRMIVDREREIRAFVPEEYWVFTAHLQGQNPPAFRAKAIKLDDKKFAVRSTEEANTLKQELSTAAFVVETIKKSTRRQQSPPPFITSKLQQEANRRFKFPAKKTMQVAQRLYEGIELGAEGSIGLITYMRTDSTRVAPSATEAARQYINDNFGPDFLPPRPRIFKKAEGAQDAHEAIRPSDVNRSPASLKPHLGDDEFKIYNLIWQRFVASQMEAATFDHTDIKIRAGRCIFQATGDVLKFPGFLKVYQEMAEEDEKNGNESTATLPELLEKEVLTLLKLDTQQQFTQPPPRFSEATLIKALEEKGIGRPSTYAQIVTVIQNREYVVKEEGRFRPTETGEVVIDLLIASFPDLFGYEYTANMEKSLDLIEQGRQNWLKELNLFYGDFSKALTRAEQEMKSMKRSVEPTDETCSICSSPMVIRWGRFGKFICCSRYPECKNTRDVAAENGSSVGSNNGETEAPPCEKCGASMVTRKGRFGQFLACSAYPTCRNTRKLNGSSPAEAPKELSEKCPECGKPLVERSGRFGKFISCSGYPGCKYVKRNTLGMKCPLPGCGGDVVVKKWKGKIFYGCSHYPECKFTSWSRPVDQPCPACGNPYLVEKETKKEGKFLECPNKDCKHRGQI